MIDLTTKQRIILNHIDGLSNRAIAAKLHMSKDTINKYVNEYEEEKLKLLEMNPAMDQNELIQAIVEKPKYHAENRKPVKVSEELIATVDACLEANQRKRASGRTKQVMKKIDIHAELQQQGFDISYSTVKRIVKQVEQHHREAFIKQEYEFGDVCEFDWGEVKLDIGNTGFKAYQMAVFTAAKSNYRFAMLFRAQDTPAFQQSHAEFFLHCKGSFKTMVYDNMKVAVKKFVGLYEKEPTVALTQLSMYYGFHYRFCNIASGNEKGHVERSVEYIRRKAFSGKNECFTTLKEANDYLLQICTLLNQRRQSDGHIAFEVFQEERKHLLPNIPPYESCTVNECRVDKYATILYSQNHYSVPDDLVGKIVQIRAYTDQVVIRNQNQVVARHERSYKVHDWIIKLEHYLKTLYKKPGALTHSTALQQADTKIKNMYEHYYSRDNKTFLDVLEVIYEKGVTAVEAALNSLDKIAPLDMSAEKIRMICDHQAEVLANATIAYEDAISTKTRSTLTAYNQLAQMQRSDCKEEAS